MILQELSEQSEKIYGDSLSKGYAIELELIQIPSFGYETHWGEDTYLTNIK